MICRLVVYYTYTLTPLFYYPLIRLLPLRAITIPYSALRLFLIQQQDTKGCIELFQFYI